MNKNIFQINDALEALQDVYGKIDYIWTDDASFAIFFVQQELRSINAEKQAQTLAEKINAEQGIEIFIAQAITPSNHSNFNTSFSNAYAEHAHYDYLLHKRWIKNNRQNSNQQQKSNSQQNTLIQSNPYEVHIFDKATLAVRAQLNDELIPIGPQYTTWEQVADTYAFNSHRTKLLEDAQWVATYAEWIFGSIKRIWISGSFVSSKEHPSDIDIALHVDTKLFAEAWADPIKKRRISHLINLKSFPELGLSVHTLIIQDTPNNQGVVEGPYFAHPPKDSYGYIYTLFSSLAYEIDPCEITIPTPLKTRSKLNAVSPDETDVSTQPNKLFVMGRGFLEIVC